MRLDNVSADQIRLANQDPVHFTSFLHAGLGVKRSIAIWLAAWESLNGGFVTRIMYADPRLVVWGKEETLNTSSLFSGVSGVIGGLVLSRD